MTVTVTVVVPWRAGCPYRERNWAHLRDRYSWPVVEASGQEPWCKAAAVMPAVDAVPDGVVVVADADVWCDGIDEAIAAVQTGAGWAIPHEFVHRLTEQATLNVVSGRTDNTTEQRPYPGTAGGGIVVARRDVLLDVPLDPRFIGWGQEDKSWGWALNRLAGPAWRGEADLIHLWHPPQPRLSRRCGSEQGWELQRRYLQARKDPVAMRRLIEEANCESREPAEPAGAGYPPAAVHQR